MIVDSPPPFVPRESTEDDSLDVELSPILDGQLVLASPSLQSSSSSTTYFAEQGKGPRMLGKIWSVAATAGNFARGLLRSNTVEPLTVDNEAMLHEMAERLNNPGRMLNNIDITLFFQGLTNKLRDDPARQFAYALDFILSPLNNFSLDEAKQLMEKKEVASTMVIPFILGGGGILDPNHITVMMIKDGVVGYYDSKGVTSENRLMAGGTLRSLIEFCRDRWAPSAEIVENVETVQWDINSCGLHVAHYAYTRILDRCALSAPVSQEEVGQFRQTFLDTALLAFQN